MTTLDFVDNQADLLKELARQQKIETFVSLPAVVTEAYDATRNSVTVKPLIKRALTSSDGSYSEESLPTIYDVPVLCCGFGVYSISFPINIGDECLLLITDYDVQSWRLSGQESHPGDTRLHDISNAVALFGLKNLSTANIKYNQSGIVIGADSGIHITINASQMQVGGTADAAALASIVDAFMSHMNSFVSTVHGPHTHTIPSGVSGPPSLIGTEYVGGSSASTMLKVGG